MALNTSVFVPGQPSTIRVDGIVTAGGTATAISASGITLRFDSSKVTLSNLHGDAAHSWAAVASNTDHMADGWVKVAMLNGLDPGQTTTGPMLLFTVTPANTNVNITDCAVLRLDGASEMSTQDFETINPSDPCNGPVAPSAGGGKLGGGALGGGGASPDSTGDGGPGDVDQSGVVTLVDAVIAARIVLDPSYYSFDERTRADIFPNLSGDGYVTLDDVALITKIVGGMASNGSGGTAPTNVVASPVAYSVDPYPSICIAWTGATGTAPLIEESLDQLSWRQVHTTALGQASWTTPMQAASTTYYFRLRSVGNAGFSAYSSTVFATTHSGDGLDYSVTTDFPLSTSDPRGYWHGSISIPPASPSAYPETALPGTDYWPTIGTNQDLLYNNDTGEVTTQTAAVADNSFVWSIPVDLDGTMKAPSGSLFSFDSAGRTDVGDTKKPPVWAVCFVVAHFADGGTSYGTGALISNKDVLTAAHVIYHAGKLASKIEVTPAFRLELDADNKRNTPLGKSRAIRTQLPGWTAKAPDLVLNDIAFIRLDKPVGAPKGYFGVSYDPNINGKPVRLAGYGGPANDAAPMGFCDGTVSAILSPPIGSAHAFFLTNPLLAGDSGGGVWRTDRSGYNITGIATRGPIPGHDGAAMFINSQRKNAIVKLRNQP